MAQPMPESVKWTEVHGFFASAIMEGSPFGMKVDGKEVMILLGLHYWWYGVLQAGANQFNLALWRKTDSDPPVNTWVNGDSPDMIWSEKNSRLFTTESLMASKARDVTFPWPIVLIRPPRCIAESSGFTNVQWSCRLYYLLREVNDVDLAKLMVKDHA